MEFLLIFALVPDLLNTLIAAVMSIIGQFVGGGTA